VPVEVFIKFTTPLAFTVYEKLGSTLQVDVKTVLIVCVIDEEQIVPVFIILKVAA